ncbi:MAG: hypothetical protein A2992_00110 [Elusimicrobia bacterium RIFCSPLOWO2_01_FULL_59_12]|nr:MAG: hypothetical protein A2992_00110 [Elusimicrobia bacterium RIFCSPLOWO2_01_FULL_59_12]
MVFRGKCIGRFLADLSYDFVIGLAGANGHGGVREVVDTQQNVLILGFDLGELGFQGLDLGLIRRIGFLSRRLVPLRLQALELGKELPPLGVELKQLIHRQFGFPVGEHPAEIVGVVADPLHV